VINSKNKTLIIIAKKSYENKISAGASTKQTLNDGTIMLTFVGSHSEINQLFIEIHAEMLALMPSKRDVIVMADETGILYDQRPNSPKWNCGISTLLNMEGPK